MWRLGAGARETWSAVISQTKGHDDAGISIFCKLHARDARGPLLPHASPSAMLSLPPDHVYVRLHALHDRRRLAQKQHVDLKELLTRSG